jgi:hypothetical protein
MEFSGNIRLRLPESLHRALTELADREGVSLNTLMVTLMSEGVGRRSDRIGDAPPPGVVSALAEAVLDSVHTPTRRGELIAQLDAKQPKWRLWIPASRLAEAAARPKR